MDPNWITLPSGERLFNPVQKTVAGMGTDPEQARVLTTRQVKVPDDLGVDVGRDILEKCKMPNDPGLRKSFALNLMAVVSKVDEEWAMEQGGSKSPKDAPTALNPKVFVPVVNAVDAAPDPPRLGPLSRQAALPRPPARRRVGLLRPICTMARFRHWRTCSSRKRSGRQSSA